MSVRRKLVRPHHDSRALAAQHVARCSRS